MACFAAARHVLLLLASLLPSALTQSDAEKIVNLPVITQHPTDLFQFDSSLWIVGKTVYVSPLDQAAAGEFEFAFVLPCQASAEPAASYVWKLNGKTLPENYADALKYDAREGPLRFRAFRPELQGTYQCFATTTDASNAPNARYVAASDTVRLVSVRAPAAFEDSTPPMELNVQIEQYKKLPCTIDLRQFSPPASVDWTDELYRSVTLGTAHQVVDPDGYLHILSVKEQLANKSLKCVAYQAESNTKVTGQQFRLTLANDSQSLENRDPFLAYPSNPNVSTFYFVKDREAKVTCIYAGCPIPTVSFRKNAPNASLQDTADDALTFQDGTLSWSRIQKANQGSYYCTGTNYKQLSWKFNVQVKAAPTFLQANSQLHYTVKPGDTLQLNCSTDADPAATVKWYKNAVLIENDDFQPKQQAVYISSDTSILRIDVKSVADSSVVQCNASNEHGYAFTNFYIRVVDNSVTPAPPTSKQSVNNSNDRKANGSAEAVSASETEEAIQWWLMFIVAGVTAGGVLGVSLILLLLTFRRHA